MLAYTLLTLYFVSLAFLVLYSTHQFVLLVVYLARRRRVSAPHLAEQDLPTVTVQLPLFNEGPIVEQLLRSVAQLDYPRHLLQVQVLDDSTDSSGALAQSLCEELAADGLNIHYIHRQHRQGFKAGALIHGLQTSTGEFIAIFDADFLPPKDFLKNAVPYFGKPDVGVVQMRWDHLNREQSLLTQCQAVMIDGHFVVEHGARFFSGLFFNFNGTAGMWRRKAIDDAGGWHTDTLTEDLDISYRAQLAGWKFVFLPNNTVPGELPAEMEDFKSQQRRWAKGGMQTCLKLLPTIWRSPISLVQRIEATFHLTNYTSSFFLFMLAVLTYPAMILRTTHNVQFPPWVDFSMLFLGTVAVVGFYLTGQLVAASGGWTKLRFLPLMLSLGAGLCVNNTKGILEGLLGVRSHWAPTPKVGTNRATAPRAVSRAHAISIVELIMAAYFAFVTIDCLRNGALATVPFMLLFFLGFAWTGTMSLWPALQATIAPRSEVQTS